MKNRFSAQLKKFFTLTKSEQRGVVVLLLLLFIILILNAFLPFLVSEKTHNYSMFQKESTRFMAEKKHIEDSIHIEKLQNSGALDYKLARQKLKPFPFNPNKLPEKQWLKMGLTSKQVKSIKKYEAKGGKFRRKEDVKKLYVLSDVEYKILAPYIKIPDDFISGGEKSNEPHTLYKKKEHIPVKLQTTGLNRCDSTTLIRNLGLSPWLAARVIKYRRLLGGYYNKTQLLEVYGMKNEKFRKINKYLTVDTTALFKIDVNNAGFKEIMHHPYFDFSTTKKLMQGRKKRDGYRNMKEIKEDLQLSDSAMNIIKHYLYLRPFKNYKDE